MRRGLTARTSSFARGGGWWSASFLIVDLAYLAPATSGIGYMLVLTRIPVYFIWLRLGHRRHDID